MFFHMNIMPLPMGKSLHIWTYLKVSVFQDLELAMMVSHFLSTDII